MTRHRLRIICIAGSSAAAAAAVAIFVLGGLPARASAPPPIDSAVVAPAEQLGDAFAAVAARVRPAVVSVYSEKIVKTNAPAFPFPFGDDFLRRFFGGDFPAEPGRGGQRQYKVPQRGMGSGMIIDTDGHILTNYHVVRDVDEIKVQLADKRSFEAEIVGTDPPSDTAVIRIKGDVPADLPTVELGDSDTLEVGNLVMAIGAPFGYVQTVTTGVLSARSRSGIGINTYEDFLQTDTAINPGNSGGPLVDMHGRVIGINSAIATSVGQFSGVGFAIPINMVKTILPTLLKGEKVTRGLLGVIIQEVTGDLARSFGVSAAKGALVSQVNPDSPAAKAGIKPGDVIVNYDGKAVEDTAHLRNMVAGTAPGTRVHVDLIRNGKKRTVAVTIGRLNPETAAATPGTPGGREGGAATLNELGLGVQTLTPDLAERFGYENRKGVLITDIRPGSASALAGLREGDLIVEVDRRSISNTAELLRAIDQAKSSGNVLLLLARKNASLFVVLPLK